MTSTSIPKCLEYSSKGLLDCYPQPSKINSIASIATETPSLTTQTKEFQNIMREFPSVFDGRIKTMDGEKYRDKLKAELEILQSQGIITPVTVPTEWCAPIVVTPKKDTDAIKMCVDLSHLNKYVKRERYQLATPAQAVADISAENAKIFTKLDAMKGYHQCSLDEESQTLTTFITPFVRFKYLRAPYGISSISEHYNRRMDEAFAVDDIIIYNNNAAQYTDHVRQFLQRCAECQITLNTDKWKFSQDKIDFAGFTISAEGYCTDPSITDAISNFPTLTSRTDLRSFFGLVNQLSASTASVAGLLAPLRPTSQPSQVVPIFDLSSVSSTNSQQALHQ